MKLLMRYPHYFGFNEETAADNEFQNSIQKDNEQIDQKAAQVEFENMVRLLRENDIDVIVVDAEEATTKSPDAIFPNNWFSTHPEGYLFTYPMLAKNRRTEVNAEFVKALGSYQHIALEQHASGDLILEGTGSLIIDREAKLIYASRSERTNETLLEKVAQQLGYDSCIFDAFAPSGKPIYHTNVVMHVGHDYVCAGTYLIPEPDRSTFKACIKRSGKELIKLSTQQVIEHFAGNMIQVTSTAGKHVLLLSENAYTSLSNEQRSSLSEHNDVILPIPIPTIERIGGGSVRCIVAEVF
jgi:hypothetical protein